MTDVFCGTHKPLVPVSVTYQLGLLQPYHFKIDNNIGYFKTADDYLYLLANSKLKASNS